MKSLVRIPNASLTRNGAITSMSAKKRISIRPAEMGDSHFVLSLRNAEDSVRLSISGKSISAEEHEAWFSRSLESKNTKIFIGEFADSAVEKPVSAASVRFDRSDSEMWVVSIAVFESYRGQGIGSSTLRLAMVAMESDLGSENNFIAHVHHTNESSIRLFNSLGFVLQRRTGEFLELATFSSN